MSLRHRNVGNGGFAASASSSSGFMESFKQLDAYAKPMEDFRVKTSAGGLITLISSLLISLLVLSEFFEYRNTSMEPSLVVEKNRRDKMWIQLNITFPRMPCHLIGADVMDVSGEQQNDISASIYKVRLDKSGNKISDSKLEIGKKSEPAKNTTDVVDPNYCGDCYGGEPRVTEDNPKGCCNTCEQVREAYQRRGWSFNNPENIDQCVKEGYVDKLREQANEGCNINGHLEVSRVAGNFHFAPGKSFQQAHMHVHDLHQFMQQMSAEDASKYDFTHIIHYLSFGEVIGFGNPLDGISRTTTEGAHMYQYFIKVVGTRFNYLNGSTISTNQFSVTEHERSVLGPDGRQFVALPGVFFNFEISPMTVIYTQQRKSFWSFLVGVCAIIGGIFTVASIIDSFVYNAEKVVKKKVDLGKQG